MYIINKLKIFRLLYKYINYVYFDIEFWFIIYFLVFFCDEWVICGIDRFKYN